MTNEYDNFADKEKRLQGIDTLVNSIWSTAKKDGKDIVQKAQEEIQKYVLYEVTLKETDGSKREFKQNYIRGFEYPYERFEDISKSFFSEVKI